MKSPHLLSLREILDCQVDVDKNYIRLKAKEGLEFALDLRKLGLVTNGSRLGLAPFPQIGDAQSPPIVHLTMDEVVAMEKVVAKKPGVGFPR